MCVNRCATIGNCFHCCRDIITTKLMSHAPKTMPCSPEIHTTHTHTHDMEEKERKGSEQWMSQTTTKFRLKLIQRSCGSQCVTLYVHSWPSQLHWMGVLWFTMNLLFSISISLSLDLGNKRLGFCVSAFFRRVCVCAWSNGNGWVFFSLSTTKIWMDTTSSNLYADRHTVFGWSEMIEPI